MDIKSVMNALALMFGRRRALKFIVSGKWVKKKVCKKLIYKLLLSHQLPNFFFRKNVLTSLFLQKIPLKDHRRQN